MVAWPYNKAPSDTSKFDADTDSIGLSRPDLKKITEFVINAQGSDTAPTISDLGSVAGGVNMNIDNHNVFKFTATNDITLAFTGTFVSTQVTQGLIHITNGGAHTVTYSGNMKFTNGAQPTLTSSGTDLLSFISIVGDTEVIINHIAKNIS